MTSKGKSPKAQELQQEVRAMELRSKALMKKLEEGRLSEEEHSELEQLLEDIRLKGSEAIYSIRSETRKT